MLKIAQEEFNNGRRKMEKAGDIGGCRIPKE